SRAFCSVLSRHWQTPFTGDSYVTVTPLKMCEKWRTPANKKNCIDMNGTAWGGHRASRDGMRRKRGESHLSTE
ncbi:MAG TPA: hypothetical protein VIX20_17150, partial [Ktedonobacteraceae bacterium]